MGRAMHRIALVGTAAVAAFGWFTGCASSSGERGPSASPPVLPHRTHETVKPAVPEVAAASGDRSSGAGGASPGAWPFDRGLNAEQRVAQDERLRNDAGPLKTNWIPPGRSGRYGHAEGLIAAPYPVVRARLVDFAHYRDLAGPKFKRVSLVDKQPGSADIYFQLPIMKGLVTLWYITRFAEARPGPGDTEVIEGTFVRGNIKEMHLVFSLRKGADEKSGTVLVCDLLLSLDFPAPEGPLDEELRDACGDAITNVRARTVPAP